MNELMGYITATTGLVPALQVKIFGTAVLLALALILKGSVLHIFYRRSENFRSRFLFRKTVNYIVAAIILLVLINIWFNGFSGIQTYLGLLTAGLAIALRDPLTNLAAWLFILARKPFSVGDRIEIGAVKGDVIDIRVFQFLLLEIGNRIDAEQSTGRIVFVPNGRIFTEAAANYTTGFPYIWNEIAVLLTFESDWRRAKTVLKKIIEEYSEPIREKAEKSILDASRVFLIAYKELRPALYTSAKDSGVLLTIRYLCETRGRRQSEHEIWEKILTSFAAEEAIDLAYPTLRCYTAPPPPEETDEEE